MPTIVAGQTKTLIVRFQDSITGDPFDLTGADLLDACFTNADGTALHLYYVAVDGDIATGSPTINNVTDTTNIYDGQPVYGVGIPVGATVINCPNSPTSPTAAGVVTISANATATATQEALTFGDITIYSPAVIGKIAINMSVTDTDGLEQSSTESFQVTIVKNNVTSVVQFPSSLNVVASLCP